MATSLRTSRRAVAAKHRRFPTRLKHRRIVRRRVALTRDRDRLLGSFRCALQSLPRWRDSVLAGPAFALDKVKFGTNWLADPEAGGFYQAAADGTYAKYGLDVTIIPGGPQANGGLLLLFGKIEFFMGGDMIGNLLSAESQLPLIAVAADFQKSRRFHVASRRRARQMGGPAERQACLCRRRRDPDLLCLAPARYGFKDENIRPYISIPRPSFTTRCRSSRVM